MGIFTRFKDIVSANINAMLEKAEDPEKMIRLMIQEMEETLIELKASCAGIIADKMKIQRDLSECQDNIKKWEERAKLAVDKGREDLAREALLEKQRYQNHVKVLEEQVKKFESLISQSQSDIGRLEEKINGAREKQRLLIQRHIHAQRKIRAENNIRRARSSEAMIRFEEYEHRIDRMEAAADLVNPEEKNKQATLEQQFRHLENDETIEKELQKMKDAAHKEKQSSKTKSEQK
jgi:phage shock protein A